MCWLSPLFLPTFLPVSKYIGKHVLVCLDFCKKRNTHTSFLLLYTHMFILHYSRWDQYITVASLSISFSFFIFLNIYIYIYLLYIYTYIHGNMYMSLTARIRDVVCIFLFLFTIYRLIFFLLFIFFFFFFCLIYLNKARLIFSCNVCFLSCCVLSFLCYFPLNRATLLLLIA